MIRPATLLDVPDMLDLAERFHAESALAYVPFNREKLARVIGGLIDYPRGLALVAIRCGRVIGGFLGVAEEHFFADVMFSTDLCTFIAPEYRGGMVGPALLRAYVRWAKQVGVACINAGIVSGINQPRTVRVFESVGFAQTGVSFEYQGI